MRIVTEEFIKSLRIGLGIKLHLPFFDNLEWKKIVQNGTHEPSFLLSKAKGEAN
jgi:hypothetical protein